MRRRTYLATIGALGSIGIAGCSGSSEGGGEPEGDADPEPTEATTEAPTSEDASGGSRDTSDAGDSRDTSDAGGSGSASYRVQISYDGEWSGTIAAGGSSRSVDGSGTQTFSVDGDPTIVSANAQKRDDGSGELTVEILEGGEVIAEESTSAEFGVAQVTSEDDPSSSGGAGGSGSTFEVRIEYSGDWQGTVSAGGSARSIEGSGSRTIPIDGSPDILSANAQKQDDSSGELVVQILKDGEVVEETATTAEYGVAQVSHSDF